MSDLDADRDVEIEEAEQLGVDAIAERVIVDPRTLRTRFSLLKQMSLSPAHYLEACQKPQDDSIAMRLASAAVDKREALRFGTATHAMLFGTGEVAVYRDGRRSGNAWKAFMQDCADHGVVEILNAREHALATGIVEALKRHDVARRLLLEEPTHTEVELTWSWMGKLCRSTPDTRGKGWIADLKTARTANPAWFVREGARLYYHCQAAFYGKCLDELGHGAPGDAYVIAVEKTRPHPVTVLRFTEDTLELGARTNRLWFERLLQCEATNTWPEYLAPGAIGDFAIDPPSEPFTVEIDGQKVEV